MEGLSDILITGGTAGGVLAFVGTVLVYLRNTRKDTLDTLNAHIGRQSEDNEAIRKECNECRRELAEFRGMHLRELAQRDAEISRLTIQMAAKDAEVARLHLRVIELEERAAE